jgi:hypothetical protein
MRGGPWRVPAHLEQAVENARAGARIVGASEVIDQGDDPSSSRPAAFLNLGGSRAK